MQDVLVGYTEAGVEELPLTEIVLNWPYIHNRNEQFIFIPTRREEDTLLGGIYLGHSFIVEGTATYRLTKEEVRSHKKLSQDHHPSLDLAQVDGVVKIIQKHTKELDKEKVVAAILVANLLGLKLDVVERTTSK
jgi:hypothetical protein